MTEATREIRAIPALSRLAGSVRAALHHELSAAIEMRHELHAAPELSGHEEATAARAAAALGAPDAPAVAATGRVVRIGNPSGPCVAIRAELDALPITEQTGVPWSAPPGAMHACGHDVHLAAVCALGRAARLVELPAALLVLLQPREETLPSGGEEIVTSGVLDAHAVRAVVGVHVQPQLPRRTVAATVGPVNAANDEFEVIVEGRSGHAGYPHAARDPVLALCHTVVALQQLVSRRTDPTQAAVVSIGTLEAGGAANVIPGVARATGSLRTLEASDRAKLHEALPAVVEHICRAHDCHGRVTIHAGEPALVNDPALASASWPWLHAAGFAIDASFRSCGADDFAHYGSAAPTLMLFLGTRSDEETIGLHHPRFLPDDSVVEEVAEAMLAGFLAAVETLLPAGS